MNIAKAIHRILMRLSTFGPSAPSGTIPADARPISEENDPVDPDMGDGKGEAAGSGDAKAPKEGADGDAEGSGQEDPQGSGTDDDADPQDGSDGEGGDTSTEPSPDAGTSAGATEAFDSAARVAAAAVRAAVDALVAQPDTGGPTKMNVRFTPTITSEQLKAYEAKVDAGKEAEGLSELIGSAVAQALSAYDENRVLPVEKTLDGMNVDRFNDQRIAAWEQANPEEAKDPALRQKMTETYVAMRDKLIQSGVTPAEAKRRLTRVGLDQLAIIARAEVPVAKGAAKKPAQKTDPQTQKREALGATRTPGAIATLRKETGKAPAKGKGYDGASYRDYVKSQNRDPF